VTEQVRSTADATIAFDTRGAGTAVVLVDGAFGSRAGGANAALADLLAPHFTVHRYDRRGRGESSDAPPSVEGEIADLAAVIDAVGGSACVFGTSSGGNLVLRAAADGVAMSKIAVWEPNFLVGNSRPPLPADYVERLNSLVGSDRRSDAVEYFMTAAVGLPAEFVGPMRETPMWPALTAQAHTLAYDGTIVAPDMAGAPISASDWVAVEAPTLVVDGGSTPWLSKGADALAEALGNAHRETLAGQQHDVEAAALAPTLIAFFGQG